jgi:hypothetical protein
MIEVSISCFAFPSLVRRPSVRYSPLFGWILECFWVLKGNLSGVALVEGDAEVFATHGYEGTLAWSTILSSTSTQKRRGTGVPRLVKLKRTGRERFPFAKPLVSGRRVVGSRNSLKNSWVRASRAGVRAVGVYCNKLLRRSITSGPTCRRKIYEVSSVRKGS